MLESWGVEEGIGDGIMMHSHEPEHRQWLQSRHRQKTGSECCIDEEPQ